MKPPQIITLEKNLGVEIYYDRQHTQFSFSNGNCSVNEEEELTKLNLFWGRLDHASFLGNFTSLTQLSLSYKNIKNISFIKNLKRLVELDLSNNEIIDGSPLKGLGGLSTLRLNSNGVVNVSFLKNLTNLTYLDLSVNGITDITFLKDLTNLTDLDLSGNGITDITFLKDLKNLTDLNLSRNRITDASLQGFPKITSLKFSGNPLQSLTLDGFPGLQTIDLANLKLEKVSLSNLPNLVALSLRNNRVKDISSLKNVPALTHLDIDLNPISDYSALKTLPLLEVLMMENKITDVSSLENMTYLREIYLSGSSNNTELIEYLSNSRLFPELATIGYKPDIILELEKQLKCELMPTYPGGIMDWIDNKTYLVNNKAELITFRLRRMELTDISFLREFTKMEILDLRINHIQDISLLQGLTELRELHLYGNAISEIPLDFFDSLPKLEYINLKLNPIKNIPKEIFDKDENVLEAVKTYLTSLQGERAYLHQAKMILVGNGEVGKTSIRLKLLDRHAVLPKKEERTQGLDIATYTVKDLPPAVTNLDKSINFELAIWDFGGQGKYREVQQLFCSRKALYLFVTTFDDCPGKEEYIGFNYWLSMAKAYGYDQKEDWQSPIIYIVNKSDLGKKSVNEEELSRAFSNIHEFIKISCETLNNFDTLEQYIRTALPKISKDIYSNQFSKKWFTVKGILEKRRNENHLTLSEYESICTSEGLNEAEGKMWLDYLDRVGSLIYFRDNLALNRFIVLNPLWVKDSMYKVLDFKYINNGRLEQNYLPDIWQGYDEYEHEYLLAIMLAYKFCYAQTDNQGNTFYIVPALLQDRKPRMPDNLPPYKYDLRFDYRPFIPAGTANKLMVELNEYIYKDLKWKNGCVLNLLEDNKNSFAEVIEDWEYNTVFVRIGGENLSSIYNLILKTLSQLLQDIKKIKFLDVLEMEPKVKVDGEYELPKTIIKFGKERDFGFLFGKDANYFVKADNRMRTIKIFLASSMELQEDRDALKVFIADENDRLHKKGFYLELIRRENFLDAISDEGLQSEYNKAIRECDIALILFFTKAGKYTQEEFECAYQSFKESRKPLIFTYFKDAPLPISTRLIDKKELSLLESLVNFKERLQEIKHYESSYKNIDHLTNDFKRQLEKMLDKIS